MNRVEYGTTKLTNQDGTWVLALEGGHDLTTVPLLEHQMEQVCASTTNVMIDLTRATFIDCQVVGWLLRWSERARRIDHLHLAVAIGADGSCAKRLIDLVNATGSIPCQTTMTEALVYLRHSDAQPEHASMSADAASEPVCA
jgi:anti-anti-sigma regulatory factor